MIRGKIIGIFVIWNIISLALANNVPAHSDACRLIDFFQTFIQCDKTDQLTLREANATDKCDDALRLAGITGDKATPLFLFYAVNSSEGFNLRRDVYIRLIVFLKWLRKQPNYENSLLVLPPFYQLYHWQVVGARKSGQRSNIDKDVIFFNHFFDLASLRRYTAVIDMWEYFDIIRLCYGKRPKTVSRLDRVFQLKHFQSMFQSGKFEEKFEVQANCDAQAKRNGNQFVNLYQNFGVQRFDCVEFQGTAQLLHGLLQEYRKDNKSTRKPNSVAFLNAETVLHDRWGGAEFWQARRSMRFNNYLVEVANTFREFILNSTDEYDKTVRPSDWRDETGIRQAIGGNYLCAHLRRSDFLHGREETTPSLRAAAIQISDQLRKSNLTTVFISSDCTGQEYHSLKSYLKRFRVVKFTPSSTEERERLKPGGIAIVDQIICSHARYFIGTYESTFTYRIYEERKILGLPKDTTFNTFCKSHTQQHCSRNSVWPIVF